VRLAPEYRRSAEAIQNLLIGVFSRRCSRLSREDDGEIVSG
jgi:hypothetical protein